LHGNQFSNIDNPVFELAVAELVEASKHRNARFGEKSNGGFDRLNHHDKVAEVCLTLLRTLSLSKRPRWGKV